MFFTPSYPPPSMGRYFLTASASLFPESGPYGLYALFNGGVIPVLQKLSVNHIGIPQATTLLALRIFPVVFFIYSAGGHEVQLHGGEGSGDGVYVLDSAQDSGRKHTL